MSFNKNDLLKFRNFGKKSLTELEDLVQSKNLQFGMNVAKYKLDKDFTRTTLKEVFPNAKTFPVITVNGVYIGGYTELDGLLNK